MSIPHLLFHCFPPKGKYGAYSLGFASRLSINLIAEGIKVRHNSDWRSFVDSALDLSSPIGGISYEQFVDAYMRNYDHLDPLEVYNHKGEKVSTLSDIPKCWMTTSDKYSIDIANALDTSTCFYIILPRNGASIDSVYVFNHTVYCFNVTQDTEAFADEQYSGIQKEINAAYMQMGGTKKIVFKYCLLRKNRTCLPSQRGVFLIPMSTVFTGYQHNQLSKQNHSAI